MHQKQPPAKIAVLVAGAGAFWPRPRSTRSAAAAPKSRAKTRILFMIVDLRQCGCLFVSVITAKLGKSKGNFRAYPRRNGVEDLPRQCGAQCLSPGYWHRADTWLHAVIAVVSLFL